MEEYSLLIAFLIVVLLLSIIYVSLISSIVFENFFRNYLKVKKDIIDYENIKNKN